MPPTGDFPAGPVPPARPAKVAATVEAGNCCYKCSRFPARFLPDQGVHLLIKGAGPFRKPAHLQRHCIPLLFIIKGSALFSLRNAIGQKGALFPSGEKTVVLLDMAEKSVQTTVIHRLRSPGFFQPAGQLLRRMFFVVHRHHPLLCCLYSICFSPFCKYQDILQTEMENHSFSCIDIHFYPVLSLL